MYQQLGYLAAIAANINSHQRLPCNSGCANSIAAPYVAIRALGFVSAAQGPLEGQPPFAERGSIHKTLSRCTSVREW